MKLYFYLFISFSLIVPCFCQLSLTNRDGIQCSIYETVEEATFEEDGLLPQDTVLTGAGSTILSYDSTNNTYDTYQDQLSVSLALEYQAKSFGNGAMMIGHGVFAGGGMVVEGGFTLLDYITYGADTVFNSLNYLAGAEPVYLTNNAVNFIKEPVSDFVDFNINSALYHNEELGINASISGRMLGLIAGGRSDILFQELENSVREEFTFLTENREFLAEKVETTVNLLQILDIKESKKKFDLASDAMHDILFVNKNFPDLKTSFEFYNSANDILQNIESMFSIPEYLKTK